ncbi:hypothetical protein BDZ97DRAFT_5584 [Flammula alnicola]|nr:hypothetical protein BDZ97DRAFT_5584 [Flammula alnicola]
MSFFQQARNVLVNNGQFYLEQTSVVEKNGLAGLQILSHNITHGATHDSAEREPPPRCHPETRKAVVSDIIEWVNDSSRASNILWLHGPAGIGKTAIAQTVCELCQRNGQLGGSFFFSRASPGRNHGQNLVATIAYQLAIAIPQVANAIESTIANDPAILSKNMKLQFEKLIVEPLRLLYYLTATTFIIFIDGLDECEGEQMEADIAQLFGSMFEGDNLPICLMVTSRPEPWIQHAFESTELLRNARRISLEQTAETDEDIRTVLRAGFLAICESPEHKHAMRDISKPWPSYSVIDELVGRASGQFVYATTVLKFVDDPNNRPTENLDIILQCQREILQLPVH